ncbi:hypothetical protein ACFVYP_19900 [Kitasatospora sp. NPDC058201]|uniref:hypothetical protein n=1 Tax=unclassified Kitasatospora TaxID=2633591 RepID=UPI00364C247D
MAGLAALALWIVLVAWALERNHRRRAGPRPSLHGRADIHDRDTERVRAELGAAADRGNGAGRSPCPRGSVPDPAGEAEA